MHENTTHNIFRVLDACRSKCTALSFGQSTPCRLGLYLREQRLRLHRGFAKLLAWQCVRAPQTVGRTKNVFHVCMCYVYLLLRDPPALRLNISNFKIKILATYTRFKDLNTYLYVSLFPAPTL